VSRPSSEYEPRRPGEGVLYQIVRDHFETFRAQTRLEQVCRYALRPPVATDRLAPTAEGGVRLQLRHRWADGTTHLVFEPLEFLGRLAVLVPRPRINLILYYGVLGARAAWRREVVPARSEAEDVSARPDAEPEPERGTDSAAAQPRGYLWAELMKRTFGFDVLACPGCGGRLRLVALIDEGPGEPPDPGAPWPASRRARAAAGAPAAACRSCRISRVCGGRSRQ
jgi:hypothetical protein